MQISCVQGGVINIMVTSCHQHSWLPLLLFIPALTSTMRLGLTKKITFFWSLQHLNCSFSQLGRLSQHLQAGTPASKAQINLTLIVFPLTWHFSVFGCQTRTTITWRPVSNKRLIERDSKSFTLFGLVLFIAWSTAQTWKHQKQAQQYFKPLKNRAEQ